MNPQYIGLVAAFVFPVVLFIIILSMMRRYNAAPLLKRGVVCVTFLVSWIIVLLCAFTALAHHQRDWMREHKKGPFTEEEMIALGDYPDVFATWLMFGWIPVVIGYFLARRLIRNPKSVAKKMTASDD